MKTSPQEKESAPHPVVLPEDHLNRLWHISDPAGEDRRFRHAIFRKLPEASLATVTEQYEQTCFAEGKPKANLKLLKLAQKALGNFPLHRIYSNSCITDLSKHLNQLAWELDSPDGDELTRYRRLSRFISSYNLTPPKLKPEFGPKSALIRMTCIAWWKRQLKRAVLCELEEIYRYVGKVRKQADTYISNDVLRIIIAQNKANHDFMELMELENEEGERLPLATARDASVANPEIRRNELMTRISGMEKYAEDQNHKGLFLTITTPSRMHPFRSATGQVNPAYDGTSTREAHKYLCGLWACIRPNLDRKGIVFYGIRVVEPHHDGTPHWHLLVFVQRCYERPLLEVCEEYALKDSKNEPGARKHRFTSKAIDRSKGSAVGYIAKYISKNIDGSGIEETEYAEDAKDSAVRVKGWASLNRIRQFTFFGQPPVSVWRELRRLRQKLGNALEPFRQAADSGEWKHYIELMGGVTCRLKDRPVKLLKQWSDRPNAYGEPSGYSVMGLRLGSLEILTHLHTWSLIRTGTAKDSLDAAFSKANPTSAFTKVENILRGKHQKPAIAEKSALGDSLALGSGFFSSLEFCQ